MNGPKRLLRDISWYSPICRPENPDCIKELLHKYIVTIDVWDDAVEICSIADFWSVSPAGGYKKTKTAEEISDSFSTAGCGNWI